MYIENVVIGIPVVNPSAIFSYDLDDWQNNEKAKTYYTEERYLPKILKDIGFVSSNSEVRRNKPNLCITLNKLDFIEVKWGKKKCWILVGLDNKDFYKYEQQEYRDKAFKLNEQSIKKHDYRDINMGYINAITGRSKKDAKNNISQKSI